MQVQAFAPNHLGDVVLALPALRRLADQADLHVVAPDPLAELLEGQGDWTVGAPRRGGDAVLLAPSLRVALRARLARCRRIVGEPTDARRLLLTHVVPRGMDLPPVRGPRLLPRRHQGDSYLAVVDFALREWGAAPSSRVDRALRLDEPAVRGGQVAYEALGRPTHLVHPCAGGRIVKAGDLDIWAARAGARIATGARVAVTGGPSARDHDRASALARALGVPHAAGPEAIALPAWAALARRVGRVVAPDTGVAHLASAAGAAVTVLFGPTDPRRHRPLGPGPVTVLDGGHGRSCAPCYGTSCSEGPTAECMRARVVLQVTDEEVA